MTTATPAYPPPPSCKGVYPFRLGTTSFIYPDDYIPNVRVLGPCVDEIELLMFESRWPDSLPAEETVDALAALSAETGTGYNIHLPTDVALASDDPGERGRAVEILGRFIAATAPLSPSVYALHLPVEGAPAGPEGVRRWRENAARGIEALLACGVRSDRLAVETLDYPFSRVEPLIEAFGLSICMDIGHLILHGVDPRAFFHRHRERIPLIHLHGVRQQKAPSPAGGGCCSRDHVGLDETAPEHLSGILEILNAFEGVVSLEVFSHGHLVRSLGVLEAWRRREEGRR